MRSVGYKLNDDDGLPNSCVRIASGESKPYLGSQVAEGFEKSLAENPNFHYTPFYYPDKFTIRTLMSHDTEESENSLESPHLGEIKRVRKQCVPGACADTIFTTQEALFVHVRDGGKPLLGFEKAFEEFLHIRRFPNLSWGQMRIYLSLALYFWSLWTS